MDPKLDEKKLRVIEKTVKGYMRSSIDKNVREKLESLLNEAKEEFKDNPESAHKIIRPLYKITLGLGMLSDMARFSNENVEKSVRKLEHYNKLVNLLNTLKARKGLNWEEFSRLSSAYVDIRGEWIVHKYLKEMFKTSAIYKRIPKEKIEGIRELVQKAPHTAIEKLKELDPAFREMSDLVNRLEALVDHPDEETIRDARVYIKNLARIHQDVLINFLENKIKSSPGENKKAYKLINKLKLRKELTDEEVELLRDLTGMTIEEKKRFMDTMFPMYVKKFREGQKRLRKVK